MFKPIHFLATLCLLLAAVPAVASNPAGYSGSNWTIHSAFNDRPRKILDTPDAVYFLVHQRPYSTNRSDKYGGYYSTPSGGIFFYDKTSPDKGIQDFANFAPISGFDIQLINYNAADRTLVIAYVDGGIDIVYPDHTVNYLDDIKKRTLPGANNISSINFDADNNIWLGTKCGYVNIDHSSLQVKYSPSWDEAVTDICPVGDKVIAVINNKICQAPASSNLSLRNSFTPAVLSGTTGNIGTVTNIMSLSGSSFATVNTAGAIHFYTAADSKWNVENIATTKNILSNNHVVNQVDHTVTPTANGFYVAATDYAYVINRPEAEGQAPTLTKIALPAGGSVYSSSYDLSTFWFYGGPRKFLSKTLDGSSWSESTVFSPNAPLMTKDNNLVFSPTQGLIVVNRHPQVLTQNTQLLNSVQIASFRNGQWRDLSPYHNPAYLTETDQNALGMMNSFISGNRWPLDAAMGACVDPLYPDVLHLGSLHNGFVSVYLDDPRKNPFIVLYDNPGAPTGFNAHRFLIDQNWFGPIFTLGCDSDNVLWLYYNTCKANGYSTDIVLHAITPEGRKLALDSGDVANHYDIKTVVAPSTIGIGWWINGTALRHASNKNKIVTTTYSGDAGGVAIRVLDHNGTIEDTSDDKLVYIRKFRLATGAMHNPVSVRNIIENPVTGDIIVSTMHDTFIVNLSDPIVDGVIAARSITFTGENGQEVQFRPSTRSNSTCVDEYGRLWVATSDNGVIGLSADGKSIVAHYDATNSPIGNNDVHSLGWNPDTKSLFISADNVIAEVRVDAPAQVSSAGAADAPFATPSNVRPDFAGTVAFHNVPAGISLRVRDSKGKTVCELDAPVDGVAFWNLLDSEGNRVPSDKYTILDATGNDSFEPVVLPVVR